MGRSRNMTRHVSLTPDLVKVEQDHTWRTPLRKPKRATLHRERYYPPDMPTGLRRCTAGTRQLPLRLDKQIAIPQNADVLRFPERQALC